MAEAPLRGGETSSRRFSAKWTRKFLKELTARGIGGLVESDQGEIAEGRRSLAEFIQKLSDSNGASREAVWFRVFTLDNPPGGAGP